MTTNPKCRWLRFSLWTLFVVVTVACVLVGWLAIHRDWIRQRNEGRGWIKAHPMQGHIGGGMIADKVVQTGGAFPWSLMLLGEAPLPSARLCQRPSDDPRKYQLRLSEICRTFPETTFVDDQGAMQRQRRREIGPGYDWARTMLRIWVLIHTKTPRSLPERCQQLAKLHVEGGITKKRRAEADGFYARYIKLGENNELVTEEEYEHQVAQLQLEFEAWDENEPVTMRAEAEAERNMLNELKEKRARIEAKVVRGDPFGEELFPDAEVVELEEYSAELKSVNAEISKLEPAPF